MKLTRSDEGTYLIESMVEHWPAMPAMKLEAGEAPSVTKIIESTTNAAGLMHWAVGLEAKTWADAVDSLAVDEVVPQMTLEEARAKVREKVGTVRAHALVAQRSRTIGSLVHEAIEHHTEGMGIKWPEIEEGRAEVHTAIGAYLCRCIWAEKTGRKIVKREHTVFHKSTRTAGTLDGIEEFDGKLYVIDWKTSNEIRTQNLLQLGAYALMEPGVEGAILVKLPKTSEDMKKNVKKYGQEWEEVLLSDKALFKAKSAFIYTASLYWETKELEVEYRAGRKKK